MHNLYADQSKLDNQCQTEGLNYANKTLID